MSDWRDQQEPDLNVMLDPTVIMSAEITDEEVISAVREWPGRVYVPGSLVEIVESSPEYWEAISRQYPAPDDSRPTDPTILLAYALRRWEQLAVLLQEERLFRYSPPPLPEPRDPASADAYWVEPWRRLTTPPEFGIAGPIFAEEFIFTIGESMLWSRSRAVFERWWTAGALVVNGARDEKLQMWDSAFSRLGLPETTRHTIRRVARWVGVGGTALSYVPHTAPIGHAMVVGGRGVVFALDP